MVQRVQQDIVMVMFLRYSTYFLFFSSVVALCPLLYNNLHTTGQSKTQSLLEPHAVWAWAAAMGQQRWAGEQPARAFGGK